MDKASSRIWVHITIPISMTQGDDLVVDRSLIVLFLGEGRLSDRMLGAYNRPEAVGYQSLLEAKSRDLAEGVYTGHRRADN
jgi:hypothetical protein